MQKTICLHNKTGQKQKSFMKMAGEGNCYHCSFNKIENQNCKKFYPITIKIIQIKKGAK